MAQIESPSSSILIAYASFTKGNVPHANVSITNVVQPAHAASNSEHDQLAAQQFDGLLNRTFLDPLVGRGYPAIVPCDRALLDSQIQRGDMEEIAAPIDFLGVNYYTRRICRSDKISENDNEPQTVQSRDEETGMGWEVYPEGLSEIFDRLHRDYGFKSYFITKNGAAYRHVRNAGDHINDDERISYLLRHLQQAALIVDRGIPLHG